MQLLCRSVHLKFREPRDKWVKSMDGREAAESGGALGVRGKRCYGTHEDCSGYSRSQLVAVRPAFDGPPDDLFTIGRS